MKHRVLGIAAFVALTGLAVGAGQLASRYGRRGGDTDDEFRRVNVLHGEEMVCRAEELRGVDLLLGMGGMQCDLSRATVAPEGATVRVRGVMGGVNIVVPDTWRVTGDIRGPGGLNLDTTPPDDLPSDAPALHIDAVMVFAGVNVQGVRPPTDVIDLRPRATTVEAAD